MPSLEWRWGIIIEGHSHVYDYGLASKAGGPVTRRTLFEIGSISKTFTATLASYAQVQGKLSFLDQREPLPPALRGSNMDQVSLLIRDAYPGRHAVAGSG